MTKRRLFTASVILALTPIVLAAQTTRPFHRAGPFLLGADISWIQEDEANGSVYYDHDQRIDTLQILKTHGFNATRHHEAIFDTHHPGKAGQPASQPAIIGAPVHRPRTGRFDTNALLDLYSQMARDFGIAP